MYRRLFGATLLLGLVAVSFLDVRAQAPDKKPAAKDAETLAPGEYTGALKTTPGSDRVFTVTTETQKLVPTGTTRPKKAPYLVGYPNLNSAILKVYNLQGQYLKAQNQVANAKNVGALNKANQNLAKVGGQLQQAAVNLQVAALAAGINNTVALIRASGVQNFRIDTTKQDVDFQAMDDVKVRNVNLPEQFDEKGNPKKYTEKEKAELKGSDKTLPGYESSLDKLEAGQKVKVTLVMVKKKSTDDKDKDQDKDKDKDAEKKMQVKMIVILAEAPSTDNPKKKNN